MILVYVRSAKKFNWREALQFGLYGRVEYMLLEMGEGDDAAVVVVGEADEEGDTDLGCV